MIEPVHCGSSSYLRVRFFGTPCIFFDCLPWFCWWISFSRQKYRASSKKNFIKETTLLLLLNSVFLLIWMKQWISVKTSFKCFKSWLTKMFLFLVLLVHGRDFWRNFYFLISRRNPLLGEKSLELQIFHIYQHWCPSPQLTLSRSIRNAKEEIPFLPVSGALTKCLSQILCQSSFIPLCCTTDKAAGSLQGRGIERTLAMIEFHRNCT